MAQRQARRKQTSRVRDSSSNNTGHIAFETLISPVSDWNDQDDTVMSPNSTRSGDGDGYSDHDDDDSFVDEAHKSSKEALGQPPVMLSSVSGEKGEPRRPETASYPTGPPSPSNGVLLI